MSVDHESAIGRHQGNLVSPTREWTPEEIREHRAQAKPMDFGRLSFELHLLDQLRHLEREVHASLVYCGCRRLVAEIGSWMLADRKQRASTCRKSSSLA